MTYNKYLILHVIACFILTVLNYFNIWFAILCVLTNFVKNIKLILINIILYIKLKEIWKRREINVKMLKGLPEEVYEKIGLLENKTVDEINNY